MAVLRPSVDNIRGLGNFTQAYRWNVVFEKLPKGITLAPDAINFRAESSTIPTRTGTSTEIVIRGNKVRQPGIYDYNSPITLTVMETVDNTVSNFVTSWFDLCSSSKDGSSGVAVTKADLEAVLVLTRLDNNDKPIWKYKLIGCFLETCEEGDLDASTADPLKPALGIAYDRFEEAAV